MIANLFSKTKPLNYLLSLILLILVLIVRLVFKNSSSNSGLFIAEEIGLFVLLLGIVFLTDFISIKNELVRNNNYALLLFVSFLLFFPTFYMNRTSIIANFFVLLALRRLLSLKSLNQIKEKIFDASFWIFLATLFHFWSILFIILVFIAIIFHAYTDYRNWIIPFIAFFIVAILFFIANDFSNQTLLPELLLKSNYSLDFSYFSSIYQRFALAFFSSISVLFFVTYLFDIPNKVLNAQASHKIIALYFLIGVVIYVLSISKNNGILAFCFAPLAIMGANFIEKTVDNKIKDIVLYTILIMGLLFFSLQL